jgi:hypothetical protein
MSAPSERLLAVAPEVGTLTVLEHALELSELALRAHGAVPGPPPAATDEEEEDPPIVSLARFVASHCEGLRCLVREYLRYVRATHPECARPGARR